MREKLESPDTPRSSDSIFQGNRTLSEAGKRALQGQDTPQPRADDVNFHDASGSPITVRAFGEGDQKYIRAYDRNRVQPPERPDPGQAGYANLYLERDLHTQQVTRAKLQDIHTSPDYRGRGIGSTMLDTAEQLARQNGAREIYGSLDPGQSKDGSVHDFYTHRGYQTRSFSNGRAEVYKSLRENAH